MLLGSPPDMVRGQPLRETGSAAAHGGRLLLYYIFPRLAIFLSRMATIFLEAVQHWGELQERERLAPGKEQAVLHTENQRLLNCGARRAALRPYCYRFSAVFP